jgi:hypothetical protein
MTTVSSGALLGSSVRLAKIVGERLAETGEGSLSQQPLPKSPDMSTLMFLLG